MNGTFWGDEVHGTISHGLLTMDISCHCLTMGIWIKKKNLQKLQTGLNQNSVWAMQPLMSLFFFLSWYTLNLLLYWGIFFFHRKKSEEKTEKHLNPLKVLMQTEEVMTDNTVMVADGGDFVSTAAYILR